jgi:gas vesicle protein
MEDDNRLSYFFLGLGLGVAAGVLFAPKSGAETRELLRSKAEEGTDYAKRRAEELADAAKRRTDELTEAAKRRAEELKETASEAINRGKDTIQRHKDNLSA